MERARDHFGKNNQDWVSELYFVSVKFDLSVLQWVNKALKTNTIEAIRTSPLATFFLQYLVVLGGIVCWVSRIASMW